MAHAGVVFGIYQSVFWDKLTSLKKNHKPSLYLAQANLRQQL